MARRGPLPQPTGATGTAGPVSAAPVPSRAEAAGGAVDPAGAPGATFGSEGTPAPGAGRVTGQASATPVGCDVAPVDPVRELIEQHRALCEQAVDSLEIAAGLEDGGIGAGEAGYYRHADVFGLAEELYARVARRPPGPGASGRAESCPQRLGGALRSALLHVLPVVVLIGVRLAVPGGELPGLLPLYLPGLLLTAGWLAWAAPAGGIAVRTAYGLGAALLLTPAPGGGAVSAGLGLAAAFGVGSAEWSARWLRHAGRAHLTSTPTLAGFRSRMRPALPVVAVLHLAVLAVLSFAALAVVTALAPRPGPGGLLHAAAHRASGSEWEAQAALALLLVLVTVLAHCDRPAMAGGALLAAGASVTVLRLLQTVSDEPARLLGCAAVAVLLFPYAWSVLGRPGAHRPGTPPAL